MPRYWSLSGGGGDAEAVGGSSTRSRSRRDDTAAASGRRDDGPCPMAATRSSRCCGVGGPCCAWNSSSRMPTLRATGSCKFTATSCPHLYKNRNQMSGWAVRHRTMYRPSFNTAEERRLVAGCMSSGRAYHNNAIEPVPADRRSRARPPPRFLKVDRRRRRGYGIACPLPSPERAHSRPTSARLQMAGWQKLHAPAV